MRVGGYATITDPGATTREWDTITCRHCQRVVFVTKDAAGRVTAPADRLDFCRGCMSPICASCGAEGRCEPFEKKLERMEKRGAFLRGIDERAREASNQRVDESRYSRWPTRG